ncbi:Up-regulated during skeletal muscle growth protein 5 [Cryptotermes secundus]|uniref:Up-regulated during skeletal muscle growth protein 5 n=1 Tax=Cryptotermes secundus TaxID=105785 RepID=A0A2J7RHN0_9NEOP|nr:Up-regulated during skeletal muscle growth protein 5 [Cryptotermes secundus]
MAGDSHVDESQFKGISKYFNSTTSTGRANVAKATYATIGLLVLFFSLKPKKKPTTN